MKLRILKYVILTVTLLFSGICLAGVRTIEAQTLEKEVSKIVDSNDFSNVYTDPIWFDRSQAVYTSKNLYRAMVSFASRVVNTYGRFHPLSQATGHAKKELGAVYQELTAGQPFGPTYDLEKHYYRSTLVLVKKEFSKVKPSGTLQHYWRDIPFLSDKLHYIFNSTSWKGCLAVDDWHEGHYTVVNGRVVLGHVMKGWGMYSAGAGAVAKCQRYHNQCAVVRACWLARPRTLKSASGSSI